MLGDETTRTASYIAWSRNVTTVAYHEHYLALQRDYHSLRSLASTWLPEVHTDVAKLGGAMNIFWGRQQHLLHLNEKQGTPKTLAEEKATLEALNDVGRAEKAATEVVHRIEADLLSIAERLSGAARQDLA
jgi:hypothetical protein